MRKKVGILGGTFNPPHFGHLAMAEAVLEQVGLDIIYFMPNAAPPHKQRTGDATPEQRLRMTELAVAPYIHLASCSYEVEKGGTSYSYDTMKQLKVAEPLVDFYFIIGGDMVDSLHRWYRIEELVELVTFVGVNRPHTSGETTFPIIHVEMNELEISSTEIREKLVRGENVSTELPQAVEKYIRQEGLYESRKC